MNILKVLTERRKTGNFGERQAVRFLRRRGYKILRRNYVAFNNEIDIIAKNKDTIAFVEVKTRSVCTDNGFESRPSASVTPEKQGKIIKTAKHFLALAKYDKRLSDLRARLDVIEVYIENSNGKRRVKEIIHMEGAFRENNELHKHTKFKR